MKFMDRIKEAVMAKAPKKAETQPNRKRGVIHSAFHAEVYDRLEALEDKLFGGKKETKGEEPSE